MGEEPEQGERGIDPGVVAVPVAEPLSAPLTETLSAPLAEPPTTSPRAPTATLGWVAVGLAALCVIADVVAVVLAVERYWISATVIAQAANVGTVAAFVLGLFAAFRRPARWLGIGSMVVAVVANPFILTHLLAFLAG